MQAYPNSSKYTSCCKAPISTAACDAGLNTPCQWQDLELSRGACFAQHISDCDNGDIRSSSSATSKFGKAASKIWPENIRKAIITLQELIFKLNMLNQTCISSKSIMQFTSTIFSDSAIFIEKLRVENRLWAKKEFLWKKNSSHSPSFPGS